MAGSRIPGIGRTALRGRTLGVSLVLFLCLLMLVPPTGSISGSVAPPAPSGARSLTGSALTRASSPSPAIIGPPHPQPAWVNVTSTVPGAAPPAGDGVSMAYDPADHETVYFGGCLYVGACPSNQTWVFANGTWSNETNPFDAPPARDYASMDYDANMHGVLLFGGDGEVYILDDTWLFRGGRWTNVTYFSASPPSRYGGALAFDPQPEENGSVLFGGYNLDLGYLNDTWVWEGGAGWVQLTTPSIAPPELYGASMAYDASDGYIVLFGGDNPYTGYSTETWELYSGQWWAASPSSAPSGRFNAQMVYVPSLSGVLLFGGYTVSDTEASDTWTFSSGAWTEKSPSTAPPGRTGFGLALDGTGVTPILFGGLTTTGADLNDTWAYEFAPGALLEFSVPSAEVRENVTFEAYVLDGTAPFNVEFVFGDGSYGFVSGPGPWLNFTHAFSKNGTYDVDVNVTDAVGATYSSGPSYPFTVTAAPAISAHATPSTGDVGYAISFNSSVVSPGTPPLTYRWTFGDGTNATTENASHAYASVGSYPVTVVATDADDAHASVSFDVSVVADPTLTVAASPTHPSAGATTTLFGNVTGGSGPYTYSWTFGDGTNASHFPDPQHVFARAGTYTVEVWANDSVGATTHQTLTVTVGSGPSSAAAGAPLWFWGAIAALAAVAVIGTIFLLRRKRAPEP